MYHLGLYNRPEVAAVPGDVSPTPQKKIQLLLVLVTGFGNCCSYHIIHQPYYYQLQETEVYEFWVASGGVTYQILFKNPSGGSINIH
jgi:hypothetical protein